MDPLPILARAFCAPLAPSLVAKLGDLGALERRLRSLIEDARLRLPGVVVDEVAFAAHMGERLADAADIEEALSRVIVHDLLLAFACISGDAVALRELDRQLDVGVHAALRDLGAVPELVEEVRSVLGQRLLVDDGGGPKIKTYTGLALLSAWLRVAALRTGISLRRRTRHEAQADDRALLDAIDPALDPESRLLREHHAEQLRSALREAMAALSARERNLLRMYYGQGIKLDKLGAMHRVNASTISRWLAQAREEVLERTRGALSDRLKLTASQVESLLGLAQSLDVNLESLLGSSAD